MRYIPNPASFLNDHADKCLKFKGMVKPVHEGWYYASYERGRFVSMYRWFDGKWWMNMSADDEIIQLCHAGNPTWWVGLSKQFN